MLIGYRPFGVSLLYAGYDRKEGFQLYQSDPSGNYSGWMATCIGKNSNVSLQFRYENDVSTTSRCYGVNIVTPDWKVIKLMLFKVQKLWNLQQLYGWKIRVLKIIQKINFLKNENCIFLHFLKIWKTNFFQISKIKFRKIGKKWFHISFFFCQFFLLISCS